MARGHAKGPTDEQCNLRVQNVIILTPGDSDSLYIAASETDPVLMKIIANVDTALPTGTNGLTVGTSANASLYMASGDSTPGTPGFATEKKFVLTDAVTLIAALASVAVAASKALTVALITGADTQTVSIGGVVYTLHTSLSGFTATAGAVLIGADVTAMAANLAAAINAGAGSGTLYGSATVANPSVSAVSALGVLTVTARTAGASGNSIVLAETLTNSSWAGGAVALSGGADASTTGQMTVFIDL